MSLTARKLANPRSEKIVFANRSLFFLKIPMRKLLVKALKPLLCRGRLVFDC